MREAAAEAQVTGVSIAAHTEQQVGVHACVSVYAQVRVLVSTSMRVKSHDQKQTGYVRATHDKQPSALA